MDTHGIDSGYDSSLPVHIETFSQGKHGLENIAHLASVHPAKMTTSSAHARCGFVGALRPGTLPTALKGGLWRDANNGRGLEAVTPHPLRVRRPRNVR